jgi:hypothetical protein
MTSQPPARAFRRPPPAPATVLALVALFLALGGSALAVGKRGDSSAATAQRACAQGNVRGIADVNGGPSGMANIPGGFTGAGPLFARRFNCTRRPVFVRRLGIGMYEVQFFTNWAANAIASGPAGVQASAHRVSPGIFRVTVYPAGRADPWDAPFLVVLV